MDLTAITTPFGLLDRETQEALKAHGGPWQFFDAYGGWQDARGGEAAWMPGIVYRVKPAPPKPREWWLVGIVAHDSHAAALRFHAELVATHPSQAFEIIHVREVLK